ncbi:MAG: hypothetical protein CMG41_05525 [Candidatus Marinimicrobia bacterium]|nr:hypothetical protein [Candidatus Neomarinimicrobiota bacterium]
MLRSDEKHDLINLKEDIRQFYINTRWDKEYSDLNIPLHIQIIFEGAAAKGNVKTYLCKALFSNGSDLRYFDKGAQFFYSPGSSLYFDLVLFEPLSAFLAFYANIILGGEIDTYDYKGGNTAYEIAREIGLRGASSDYQKGWGARISLVDDISKNTGLRSARLSYYLAKELLDEGNIDESIKEYNNMLDGLEQSYVEFRREQSTQFFMKIHSEELATIFSKLGRRNLLLDLKQLDPDNNELYQIYLDKMSK